MAIPMYLFTSSLVIQLTVMANLIEVSHLSKVDDISELQSRSLSIYQKGLFLLALIYPLVNHFL